jgi:DNA-binding response OmpR family regulator
MTAPTRVLVVEDDSTIRNLLRTILTRRGCRVTVAESGQGALDLAGGRFDLILLDLGLGDVNGLEVCRQLRARPDTARVPIIMLTGRDDPRDIRAGLAAGADDFVTKPFELTVLMASVDRVLRTGGSAPHAQDQTVSGTTG